MSPYMYIFFSSPFLASCIDYTRSIGLCIFLCRQNTKPVEHVQCIFQEVCRLLAIVNLHIEGGTLIPPNDGKKSDEQVFAWNAVCRLRQLVLKLHVLCLVGIFFR